MDLLDRPLTLRSGVTLPHRVALAPLTNLQSHPDGTLSDAELRWLAARAGHFGLLSTCAAYVSEQGHGWVGQLGVADDAHDAGLARLADALSASVAVVQLYHGGRMAQASPDRIAPADGDGARAATEDDLHAVIADFARAARRAQDAGFAGVEVHGANGYVLTQFLAPADNPRDDGWGGDLPRRQRLLREVVRAVRAATRPDFAVGVRLSPVDTWARRGLVLADGVATAQAVAEDGADWVHLSLADASGAPPHEPGAPLVARAIRDALPAEVAVLAAGGIWTREDALRALDTGVDVVALGRSAIIHPDWPQVSAAPGFEPHRPPWTAEDVAAAAVSPPFAGYLQRFPGLMVGGTPPRR